MSDLVKVRSISPTISLVFVGSEHIDGLVSYLHAVKVECAEVTGVDRMNVAKNLDRSLKVHCGLMDLAHHLGQWAPHSG